MAAEDDIQRNATERSIRSRLGVLALDELSFIDEVLSAIERYRARHGVCSLTKLAAEKVAGVDVLLLFAYTLLDDTRKSRRERMAALEAFTANAVEPPRLNDLPVVVPRTRAVTLAHPKDH